MAVSGTPEDVEIFVLSSLRSLEAVQKAIDSGLGPESWQVAAHASVWEYIVARVRESGRVPTLSDIYAACEVTLMKDIEDDQTFLDELINRTVERHAMNAIMEHGPLLANDPKRAVALLVGDLSEITSGVSAHTTYFDESDRRVREMEERVNKVASGEAIGIRTGLRALDSKGSNWHSGDVVAIQGPLNSGKSGLLLWFCAQAYFYDKKRILFLTPESTIKDIEDRLDPMIGTFMNYNLSNTALRMGTLDMDIFKKYRTEFEIMGRKDFIIRDSGGSGEFYLEDIIRQAREHRPDLLAIDGVHLIGGEGKSWELMKEAGKALKGITQLMGMVTIGGTQVQRDAVLASDSPASLGQSAFGMGFLEASNKVISLAEKRGDPLQRVWTLPKNRDGYRITDRQYLRFDIDRGLIGDLGMSVDSATGIVDAVSEIDFN